MRIMRFILPAIAMLTLATGFSARAQRVALDERVPKIKIHSWLDNAVPRKSQYTYIEFVHSTTLPCIESFLKIRERAERFGPNLGVMFITAEKPENINSLLRECSGEYIGTALDTNGDIFAAFGVTYVPFGVVVDSRGKALWFGNPLTIEDDFFDKLTSGKNGTH